MELIHKTAEEIMKELEAKEFYVLISDATGFGYKDTHKLSWLKAKELREVLVGVVKGKTVVVGENVAKAYSDECKLLSPMLKKLKLKAKYFLGDAY